jgi:hypothetical protein
VDERAVRRRGLLFFYFELAKTIQPCYNEHMFEKTNAISLDGCRHFGIIKERENYEYFLSFE